MDSYQQEWVSMGMTSNGYGSVGATFSAGADAQLLRQTLAMASTTSRRGNRIRSRHILYHFIMRYMFRL